MIKRYGKFSLPLPLPCCINFFIVTSVELNDQEYFFLLKTFSLKIIEILVSFKLLKSWHARG